MRESQLPPWKVRSELNQSVGYMRALAEEAFMPAAVARGLMEKAAILDRIAKQTHDEVTT